MKKTPVSILCLTIVYLFLSPFSSPIHSQSILVSSGLTGSPLSIGTFNLVTCEYTLMFDNLPWFNDFFQADNGLIYLLGGNASSGILYELDATGNVTVLFDNFPSPPYPRALHPLNPDEILVNVWYEYYVYNISTGTSTLLGTINGFHAFGGFFEYNGTLHMNAWAGVSSFGLYEVTLNPLGATPVIPNIGESASHVTSVCNNIFGHSNYQIFEINPDNGTRNALCYPPLPVTPRSIAPDPFNNIGPLCDCISESGNFTPMGYYPCAGETVTLQHNGDETLDGNDNFVFLLVDGLIYQPTFPSNIIYTYNSIQIDFIPGITEVGVGYRIYAVAANALADSVDLNDPCRELTYYPIPIEWQEGPTLSFSENNNECGNDCREINVTFTGSPPFELSYDVILGNGTSTSVTEVFNTYNGTFEICPPPGFEGTLTVEATDLEDANCSCTN